MQKTVIVKIGTNAILNMNGEIDSSILALLASDIACIRNNGVSVALVSSGAVGSARKEFDASTLGKVSSIELAQIRSAVGQPLLMKQYREAFHCFSIPVAQGLVTRSDFASRERHCSMRRIIEKMFRGGILPIFNENDFLTPEELDFSDNDQLAGFFAGLLSADLLVLLSNVTGFYTCHPSLPESKKIDRITKITSEIEASISSEKSTHGLGGMKSKIETAKLMGKLGIEMVIAGSREKGVLSRILEGENIGTRFLPQRAKKESGVRVWLAAGAAEAGYIVVNNCLKEVLHTTPGTSIIGVGVVSVSGDFVSGDAIGIRGELGEMLGRGVARLDAENMRICISEKTTKGVVFVHTDRLFIFEEI